MSTVSIKEACRIFGIAHTHHGICRKDLKKRFLELTKKHHPDRHGPDASAEKMRAVLAAYKVLRQATSPGGVASSTTATTSASSSDPNAPLSQEFQAPSFGASSDGVWLPWQKAASSHVRERQSKLFDDPTAVSYSEFLRGAKQFHERASKEREQREEQLKQNNTQYNAAHFAQAQAMRALHQQQWRPRSWVGLTLMYATALVRTAPHRIGRAVRFVISGK